MAKTKKPVLVTTEFRGVFFGYEESRDLDRKSIVLTDARCAIYWATKGGFLELASVGPNSDSKIGSKAPRIELFGVTSIAGVSPEAAKTWEGFQ